MVAPTTKQFSIRHNLNLRSQSSGQRRRRRQMTNNIILGMAVIAMFLVNPLQCDGSKETISWDELGVSLASKNPSTSSKDVKIFVSPQRRLSKGYGEDDSSSGDSSNSGSILNGGSSGSTGGGQQTVSFYMQPNNDDSTNSHHSSSGATVQLQSPQSQAYSALSASLASLKSRLNRGALALSHSPQSQHITSSTNFADQQSAQQQTSYINVNNQANSQNHESHSGNNDNKTIVLAIPAKINFLTDGKSSQSSSKQSQQDSNQQVPRIPTTMIDHNGQVRTSDGISYTIDSSGGANYGQQHPTRTIYINSPSQSSSAIESPGNNDEGEQQYVIVNSSDGQEINSKSNQPISYSNNNYPLSIKSSKSSNHGSTYTFATIPNGRSTDSEVPVYSSNIGENTNKYGNNGGCLDMCFGPESRWRKYSSRRYRACCMRNTNSDEQQPMSASDKLNGGPDSEDQQYSYQKRIRSSRARRERSRSFSSSPYDGASIRYGQSIDEEGHVNDRPVGRAYSQVGSGSSFRSSSSNGRGGGGANEMKQHDDYEMIPTQDKDELPPNYSTPTSSRSSSRRSRRNRARDHTTNLNSYNHQSTDSEDYRQYEDMPNFRDQNSDYTLPDGHPMAENGRDKQMHDNRPDSEEEPLAGSRPESPPAPYDAPEHYSSPSDERYPSDGPDSVDQSSSMMKGSSHDSEPSEITNHDDDDNFSHTTKAATKERRKSSNLGKTRKSSLKSYQKSIELKSYQSPSINYKRKKHGENKIKSSSSSYPSDDQSIGMSNDNPNEGFEDNNNNNNNNNDDHKMNKDDSDDMGYNKKSSTNNSSESAVSSLSRTTSHLKELLSLLEKKAKAGSFSNNYDNASVSNTQQIVTTTTTTTTTTPPPPPPPPPQQQTIQLSNVQPSSIESAILSDFSFKNHPFASSGLTIPSSYSLPSSIPETIHLSTNGQTYQLPATYLTATGPQPMPMRKRRINKGMRYRNGIPTMGLPGQATKTQYIGSTATMLGSSGKSQSIYYPSLQYPMWYRGSTGHSSPFRHLAPLKIGTNHGNNGQKSPQSTSTLFDDTRQQYDQTLSSVASSLRPTAMRFIPTRAKSLIYQPHVLPIYTRHTILAQPMDIVK